MSNITKAIATLGVVASLGVTALPLSTYALDAVAGGDSNGNDENAKVVNTSEIPVSAQINNTIAVTTDKDVIDLGTVMLNGPIATDTLVATITTTGVKNYNLYVQDSDRFTGLYLDGNTTEATNKIDASTEVGEATGWGYRVAGTNSWKAVEAYGSTLKTANAVFSGATAQNGDVYDGEVSVQFGASVKSSLAEGTYKGGVVFIATAQS